MRSVAEMRRVGMEWAAVGLFLASIGAFVFFTSCSKTNSGKEIVMGFNPAENVDVVEMNAKSLAELILEKTGLKLKTFVATDFGALIEAMRSGRVQIAFLPPFSLIQAEKIADAQVLLKAVRKGRAVYYSSIITAKNFKSVQDLKGKTIAWVDPSSATGHIIPKTALMDQGIDPDTFFARQIFAGAHDALVLSVMNGTVDAGATFSNDEKGTDGSWTQFAKTPEQLADVKKKIKVLFVTKPIPGDTLATTRKFYTANKDTVDKVVELMKGLSDTEKGRKVLKDLYHIDSMVPATSEDYDIVRHAAIRLKVN